jgi:hypothetical protein
MPEEIAARARRIRLLLLDVDGVLTTGSSRLKAPAANPRPFPSGRGGARLGAARRLQIGLLSGRPSEATTRRAAELGIDTVIQHTQDKREPFEALIAERGLAADESRTWATTCSTCRCSRASGWRRAVRRRARRAVARPLGQPVSRRPRRRPGAGRVGAPAQRSWDRSSRDFLTERSDTCRTTASSSHSSPCCRASPRQSLGALQARPGPLDRPAPRAPVPALHPRAELSRGRQVDLAIEELEKAARIDPGASSCGWCSETCTGEGTGRPGDSGTSDLAAASAPQPPGTCERSAPASAWTTGGGRIRDRAVAAFTDVLKLDPDNEACPRQPREAAGRPAPVERRVPDAQTPCQLAGSAGPAKVSGDSRVSRKRDRLLQR